MQPRIWLALVGATFAVWSACGGDDAATTGGGSGTQASVGGASGNNDASVMSGGMAGTSGGMTGIDSSTAGTTNITDGSADDSACVEGKSCLTGVDPGICRGGTCAGCTDVTDDPACLTAYGAGNLCIAGACIHAQCRRDGDCGDGGKVCVDFTCNAGLCKDDNACIDPTKPVCDVPTGTCVAAAAACASKVAGDACGGVGSTDHCCGTTVECKAIECCIDANCANGQKCTQGTCANTAICTTPIDHTYYVDATDVGTNGHTGSTTCPFKNLKVALDAITSNLENKTFSVTVVIRSALNEANQGAGAFPIQIPARILIKGENDAARPVITVPADTTGFAFSYPKPAVSSTNFGGIASLVIKQPTAPTDATKGAGIYIKGTYVDDLSGNGNIAVNRVDIQQFNIGVLIDPLGYAGVGPDVSCTHNNSGIVVSDGYLRMPPFPGQLPNHFDNNRGNGIFVAGASIMEVNGTDYAGDAAPAGKTITANGNNYGVRFFSSLPGSAALAQELTNVQASRNTSANLRIYAGVTLKVRNSDFKNNGTGQGLEIVDFGTGDLTNIDMGTLVNPGGNVFFMNSPAVCIESKFLATSVFHIAGNSFAGHDCATPEQDFQLTTAMDCSSGKVVGFTNHGPVANKWDIRVGNCLPGAW